MNETSKSDRRLRASPARRLNSDKVVQIRTLGDRKNCVCK